jgi:vacuolar protein sorting-associated protein IST1
MKGIKGLLSGGEKFDVSKMKSQLKMAMIRISQLKNKKTNLIKLQRRQVAELLVQEKDESARIKVENIIRDDYQIEALEILELFCDMLQTRLQLLAESHECPHDMKEAVTTIIYAAPRVEVPEFLNVRKLFSIKFGPQFVEKAMVNHDLTVNDKVMFKLGVKVPEPYLCVQYLKQIAEENNIEWADSSVDSAPPTSGGGFGGSAPYGGYGVDQYSQSAFPPPNYGPPPTVQSQQFHQTGTVPTHNIGQTHTSNYASPPHRPPSNDLYPPNNTASNQFAFDNTPPPYIPPTSTTSGYTVDFQPQVQHPLEHTLPTFSNPTNDYDSYAGEKSGGDEYDFDELQKRFESLKSRE